MVEVKDTLGFVQRAIQIHGDKYDYSQTVYLGSRKPITIVCRNCGPFVLAEAQSHYNPRMLCGCRACNQEEALKRIGRARICSCCGERLKYSQRKTCQPCQDLTRSKLKNRKCPNCGEKLNSTSSRKKFCCFDCSVKVKSLGKIAVSCVVCGKLVERYKRQFEKFGVAACSLKCQRQWAFEQNKGKIVVDWDVKSKKARERWKASRTRRRRQGSSDYRFWLLCKIPDEASTEEWQRRCNNSHAILKERFIGEVRRSKLVKTWKQCYRTNLTRLKNKSTKDNKEGWEWKVISIASGLKKRRRKKSLQQGKRNILQHIERQDQQPKQLSFWE